MHVHLCVSPMRHFTSVDFFFCVCAYVEISVSSGSRVMDSDMQMPPQENADRKTAFHKPLSDAANRKYRRHSPVGGSSSSDGSPKHGRKGSPSALSKDPAKVSMNRPRIKDDMRELDKDSGRHPYGGAADSHRHSDRHSSRSSLGYSKHDDNIRHDKHADDGEKYNYRLTSHAGRASRGSTRFDHTRQDSEYVRSRDSGDRYHRDRYDSSGNIYKEKDPSHEKQKYKGKDSSANRASSGRRHCSSNSEKERDQHRRDGRDETRDYYRRSGDYKSDRTLSYEESQEHGIERDRFKEGRKETGSQSLVKEERKIHDDREANRDRDGHGRAAGEKGENMLTFATENQESSAKKPKLFSPDKATDYDKDATEKESSSSKQAREMDGETQGWALANVAEAATDLDSAKSAAMRAAELVNRNLVGLGVLSTDQKKKLLWGSKKNTNVEEQSTHPWDAPLFGDRERQEKFNKLMSLRLPWYLWPIVGCEGRCQSGAQARQPRGWWPPPSRKAKGTPAGFGEAIYCWTSKKRWPNCRLRPLSVCTCSFCNAIKIFHHILLHYSQEQCFLLFYAYLISKLALLLDISGFCNKKKIWVFLCVL
ncbi:serine/threonine-protein kinase fray2-like isoform X3 [Tripterygium wilfordii]|uniref:serine/threonine-protein kinase fray2-like isoform X3 n=1 Tax=Tripterygium wilfordii TaxID=458696 RepID=UPI0018F8425F|nr:serine/threonine-protein kinase fray2-like isoform X3 [Tripterygium wilfordii]